MSTPESQEPPPFGGFLSTWPRVYAFVIISQTIFVLVVWLISRWLS